MLRIHTHEGPQFGPRDYEIVTQLCQLHRALGSGMTVRLTHERSTGHYVQDLSDLGSDLRDISQELLVRADELREQLEEDDLTPESDGT